MSGEFTRNALIGALVALILGACAWFFFTHFQASWDPVPSTSDAAARNPVLGAERLLRQRGYRVEVDRTLSLALFQPLPEGTLILADGGDSMLATQSQALLSWVGHGNTLIVSPGWRAPLFDFTRERQLSTPKKPVQDKAAVEAKDAITTHFGVALGAAAEKGSLCRNVFAIGNAAKAGVPRAKPTQNPRFTYVDCVATLTLPGIAHPLRIDASKARLVSAAEAERQAKDAADCDCKKKDGKAQASQAGDEDDDADGKNTAKPGEEGKPEAEQDANEEAKQPEGPVPVLADDDAKAVRVYAYGQGRVVILAQHYFDNYDLAIYDHAELLLGLAALNTHKNVTLIQRVDIASWFSILWHAAPYAICTLALFLLLWAWSAMRRFGPQLPDPDDRRRALLEHVDASGRWLWKSAKGKEIMLAAMRRVALRTLSRRIPELRKLAPERQVERIATDGKMSRADLDRALLDAPGRLPIEFTQQIQTIQELRAYYER